MLQDFFTKGQLEMPQELGLAQEIVVGWGDCMANKIAMVVFIALVLIDLADMLRTMPKIWDCISLWRANLGLEHSLSTARSRNNSALVMSIGWVLLMDCYGIYPAKWLQNLGYGWSAAATAGVLIVFLALRRLCFQAFKPKRMNGEELRAVHNAMITYFIPQSILMLCSAGILNIIGADSSLICMIIRYEIAACWIFDAMRTGQILSGKVSSLATILYLCGLELLPASVLVATALLL